jgi:FtsP/CotA-like multicopper oxidase with cupredoxin domain
MRARSGTTRTRTRLQLEKGLYGALVVRGHDEPRLDGERVLVLDDLKLDRKGDIARFGGFRERHDGRLGDTRLVNGEAAPELEIAAGQVERWRIVNASSSRYALLSIGGRPFTILGTDGGLIPKLVAAEQVLLAPADRVELAVGRFSEGETFALESLPYDRGMVKNDGGRYATVRVGISGTNDILIVLAWVLSVAWMIWLVLVARRMPESRPIAWPDEGVTRTAATSPTITHR